MMALRKAPQPAQQDQGETAADLRARVAELEQTVAALARALGRWQASPRATPTQNIANWTRTLSDADLERIDRAARQAR